MANPRTRPIVDRLAPSPGEGPSEQARRAGWFSMKIRTTTETGRRYLATVAAQGDPGYAATAVMLGESALCLALDGPASLMPRAYSPRRPRWVTRWWTGSARRTSR